MGRIDMKLKASESGGCRKRMRVVQTEKVNEACEKKEPAVLPRDTKVIVTGNSRTRSVIIGHQGVVKKAVGLGGWHWLVLKNGDEVKVQRNALTVIEAPVSACEDEYQSHSFEDPEFPSETSDWQLTVNFKKLPAVTLSRYCSHFKLEEASYHSSKERLVKAVERHFASQQVDEFQVITGFVKAAKRLRQPAHGIPLQDKRSDTDLTSMCRS